MCLFGGFQRGEDRECLVFARDGGTLPFGATKNTSDGVYPSLPALSYTLRADQLTLSLKSTNPKKFRLIFLFLFVTRRLPASYYHMSRNA